MKMDILPKGRSGHNIGWNGLFIITEGTQLKIKN